MDDQLRREVNLLHANLCQALADPTRILILYALAESPRHVTGLAELLDVPQPTVSRHLKVLRERRLVFDRTRRRQRPLRADRHARDRGARHPARRAHAARTHSRPPSPATSPSSSTLEDPKGTAMALSTANRDRLKNLLGTRVTFEPCERRLYGHDIAAMPSLVRPLVGDTTPDAVVQPGSEEELAEVVALGRASAAYRSRRGARAPRATAAAIPVKKRRGRRPLPPDRNVIAIDRAAPDRDGRSRHHLGAARPQLGRGGLTLRVYPTSYPSSSVGGWLGSGRRRHRLVPGRLVSENVVEARVVVPGRQRARVLRRGARPGRRRRGHDRHHQSGSHCACGSSEPEAVTAGAAANARDLQTLVDAIGGRRSADLVDGLHQPAHGRDEESARRCARTTATRPRSAWLLPAAYILTLAYRAADQAAVPRRSPGLIASVGG